MQFIPSLSPEDAQSVGRWARPWSVLLFWFTFHSETLRRAFHDGARPGVPWHIFTAKAWGFVTMGVVPAVVLHQAIGWGPEALGLAWPAAQNALIWKWTLGLGAAVIGVAALGARKFDPQYPQVQAREWTGSMMAVNWLGWALYLAGYEFLFRGVLFHWSRCWVRPTVSIRTVFGYACTQRTGRGHWRHPVGVLLCWVTLQTESLWPAILVHIFMAWTNAARFCVTLNEMEGPMKVAMAGGTGFIGAHLIARCWTPVTTCAPWCAIQPRSAIGGLGCRTGGRTIRPGGSASGP